MANNAESMEELEFTEAEMETVELAEEEEVRIEEEMLEADLEDVESLEGMESDGQEAVPIVAAALGKLVLKKFLTYLIKYLKQVILKMIVRAALKQKLVVACKRGPQGLSKLLCPIICRKLKGWQRPLCNRLCPIVCKMLHAWVCQKVGAK